MVHLYFANRFVRDHNHQRLRDLQTPVVIIHAQHDSPASDRLEPNQLQNLEPILRVSIGCCVHGEECRREVRSTLGYTFVGFALIGL